MGRQGCIARGIRKEGHMSIVTLLIIIILVLIAIALFRRVV